MEPVIKWTKARINQDKKVSCGRKNRYLTEHEADQKAKVLMMRDGRHCSAYLCRYCKFWHVGHTPYKTLMELRSYAND